MASWLMKGQGCREREQQMLHSALRKHPNGRPGNASVAVALGWLGGIVLFLIGLACIISGVQYERVSDDPVGFGDVRRDALGRLQQRHSFWAVMGSIFVVGGPALVLLARILDCLEWGPRARPPTPGAPGSTPPPPAGRPPEGP